MKTVITALFVFICSAAFSLAAVKVVPTATEIKKNMDDDSPPIAFSRLVFNVPDNQDFGRGGYKHLLVGCTKRYPFTLETNTFNMENRVFVNTFTEILKRANYNLPGDPNALFADRNNEPEYLIAAMISNFEIDYCHGQTSGKGDGQLYMEIDWQVYNIAREEVVFRKKTEGYHQIKDWVDNILYKLLEETFRATVYNLLETNELAMALSGTKDVAVDPDFDGVRINYSEADPQDREIRIAEATQSVVTIRPPTGGHGSGFIISESGHILTNEHVVGGSDMVYVVFDNGIELEGEVLRKAPFRDVALIKVPLSRSKPLKLQLQEPDVGKTVYTIGAPLEADFSGTVSQGIISAFRLIDEQEYIQSDALINGGNSGGPMIDEKGNVVAISVSGRRDGEGINFFIPIRFALEALNISNQEQTQSKYTSDGD